MEGKGLKNWIQFINNPQRCGSENAWEKDENSKPEYHSCSLAIAKSVNLHLENIRKIQEISQLDEITLKQLEDNIWSSFEDITFKDQQDESMNFKRTLDRIFELHSKMDKPWTECSNSWYCTKAFRKIILQLKLIQLGYYGPYGATAGMYLALHRDELGLYFSNSDGNNWPHQPLSYLPNPDEKLLNEYLMKLTEALSDFTNSAYNREKNQHLKEKVIDMTNSTYNRKQHQTNHIESRMGRLKNISILDFPAFGSRLSNLTKYFVSAPNWPMEVNFAILNRYNTTELGEKFRTHKHLIKIWATYMDYIFKDGTTQNLYKAVKTEEKLVNLWNKLIDYISKNKTSETRSKFHLDIADIPSNPFDFTKNIQDDFWTFVQVYMQSHLTGVDNNEINTVWMKTAKKIFGSILDDKIVQSNGMFDGLFLDCSFQEQFMTEELAGGCNLFKHSLTSNGLCFSFNSEIPSNIWDNTFSLAKVIGAVREIKTTNISNFAGTGSKEGKFNEKIFCIDILEI